MSAYYNENDPYPAQWLRNLIKAGLIADGFVDERSIEDVHAEDLSGFAQCHFFAGIGGWSYALRLAGWTDDREVWTGSCPCQPFSVAGKGKGTSDERHLWPAWFRLIEQRRPATVFGEQVEAAIKHGWLDLVQFQLEDIGYAFGSFVLPAAGIGAPHIRHRLFFVADADNYGYVRNPGNKWTEIRWAEHASRINSMDDSIIEGLEGHAGDVDNGKKPRWVNENSCGSTSTAGYAYCMGNTNNSAINSLGMLSSRKNTISDGNGNSAPPTEGFWRDSDWLLCTDGKWRAVEPGTFPLVNGVPRRVERLRAYGNAIVPQVAKEFIAAYMECRP